MLLVSGANGNLAKSVIGNLLRLTDPSDILVTTRDPDSAHARELAARGVTVRHGDFDAPETLGPAFAGATRALLISTYADNSERLRQNLAALEEAKAAGVRHVLYTSFLGAGPDALSEHSQRVHWPTEQAIAASGLGYTILRHALYADILVGDLDDTLATGVLRRCGGAAACTYIARDDLGLSAATVLAGGGDDTVCGGDGDDVLHGEGGTDLLRGGNGDDELYAAHEALVENPATGWSRDGDDI
jgi:NAD(P)H dehydrogenase (quinone)